MSDPVLLFYKATFPHVGSVILEPDEKEGFLAECEEPPTSVEKVYMTAGEYEALREFES